MKNLEIFCEYIEDAFQELESCKYNLTIKYPEWLIPDDLIHAVNKSVEGWMILNNITPKWGKGKSSLLFQLSEIGEKEIFQKLSYIISEATFLGIELEDSDSLFYQSRGEDWTLDKWKTKVKKLVEEVEKFVEFLKEKGVKYQQY